MKLANATHDLMKSLSGDRHNLLPSGDKKTSTSSSVDPAANSTHILPSPSKWPSRYFSLILLIAIQQLFIIILHVVISEMC